MDNAISVPIPAWLFPALQLGALVVTAAYVKFQQMQHERRLNLIDLPDARMDRHEARTDKMERRCDALQRDIEGVAQRLAEHQEQFAHPKAAEGLIRSQEQVGTLQKSVEDLVSRVRVLERQG